MIKRVLFISTAFVLLINTSIFTKEQISGSEADSSVIKQEQFVNKEAGYSLRFPFDWQVLKGVMGTDLIALAPTVDAEDLFRENVNVISAKLEAPLSREEYYAFNMRSLAQLLVDFDLEESLDISLDGVEAKKIIFTHTMGVVNAKVMQFLILDGDRAYVMTFTADPLDFEQLKPKFEEIAQTFKFYREQL